jgi:propionate CoA-transferase
VAEICAPLKRRVRAVVNYEGFVLARDVEDAWADLVSEVVERWYDGVTRYTTSAFLRAKLGDALSRRKLAPHIFESEEEALAALPASTSAKAGDAVAPDAG